ncbi:hypothetical protein PV939_10335, partial [Ligilactobacillus salivarius]|nr:hypothetical protein [Ligilactobacillus salivarius]
AQCDSILMLVPFSVSCKGHPPVFPPFPSPLSSDLCGGLIIQPVITQQQFDQTRTEAINANYHAPEIAFSAPYLSEMVRQEMYNRYGESAYEDGYRIYTTITRKVQQAAQQAVRNNVLDYDMRPPPPPPEKPQPLLHTPHNPGLRPLLMHKKTTPCIISP